MKHKTKNIIFSYRELQNQYFVFLRGLNSLGPEASQKYRRLERKIGKLVELAKTK